MADRSMDSPAAGAIVSALSHPLRPQIIALAATQPITSTDVSLTLGIPLPNAAYHVRALVTAGLLRQSSKREVHGIVQRSYVLDAGAREEALGVLEETIAKLRGPG